MNSSPCAKLTTSMIPKISVSPEATRARIKPLTTPLSVWMRKASMRLKTSPSFSRSATALPGRSERLGGLGGHVGVPHLLNPQVLMDDGVVGAQLSGRRVVADDALFHDVDAVADLEGQRDILLHEEDGHALAVEHPDDLVDLPHHARHQPFGRLVEEDDLGFEHHGARNGE